MQSLPTAFNPPKLRGMIPPRCRDKRHAMNFIKNQSNTIKTRLDLDGALDSLPSLLHASVGLGTHDATSPVTGSILVV
jgi:hypothetical protein